MSNEKERAGLASIDDDDDDFDFSSLAGNVVGTVQGKKETNHKAIEEASIKAGFPSREAPKARRPKSPYQVQMNFKTRIGMGDFIEGLAKGMGCKRQELLERGLGAYLRELDVHTCPDIEQFRAEFSQLLD